MLHEILNFILTIDKHLIAIVSAYGVWAYGLLFLVIFCETGLIVTPFLPGDSLLFIAGSLSTQSNSSLQLSYLFFILVFASWLGNQINFMIGSWVGPKVFSIKNSWLFKPQHLNKTHQFYEKYGKITLLAGRFMPIIRTFAPFVAGVAKMNPRVFFWFNFISAVIWVGSLLSAGYLLGQIPFVQQHLNFMIYGIILVSLLPILITFINEKVKN